ncbi:Copper metallochaperone, bacterial analog of Cox17 protein [Hyphomicrobiales bacterium]|nr:Copper metallochaperone, bacterial analog of Cox17 protein [Hyphomicrobiales bacterium]CAH1697938.1 Copper metallochaperone, bacterial analog of Cox17 protein [Hyphomicrobiales bacterium]CAI0347585.1 periplasmic copper chaperone A [Hyphomicrobiales bacterium]
MKLSHSLAAIALALSSTVAFAHGFQVGPLKIGHPWSRATPAGAKVGGGYLSIENTGSAPDRLVSVSVPFAARAEIHEMAVKDGIMTMRPLEQGVAVPAGAKIEFKPGGYHIMFMELKQPLKQGELMKGTLTFEKAGSVDVEFKVDSIAAKGEGEHKGH